MIKIAIIISGKAGSGKDYLANRISDRLNELNYEVVMRGFSDTLKEMTTDYLMWNGIKDAKGRKLLAGLGNLIREYDSTYLIRRVYEYAWNRFNEIKSTRFVLIAQDNRFANENELLSNNPFFDLCISIRCNRNRQDRIDSLKAKGETVTEDDITETAMDDYDKFDYIFFNDNKEKTMQSHAKMVINKILEFKL